MVQLHGGSRALPISDFEGIATYGHLDSVLIRGNVFDGFVIRIA